MVNSPESHLDQHEKEVAKPTFQYDAFISYSTGSDYAQARKIESFLESFHKSFKPAGVSLKQMHICRDGSDFRLPAKRENTVSDDDPIWNIIVGELAKSRYLIVLCSPESTRSVWVEKEIAWMMKHHGAASILPVLTNSNDPVGNPHECFPSLLRDAGLHKARLWYDLRSFVTTSSAAKVRVADDELVRLASDLLDWDASQYGPLAPLWLREQLKKRRRQAVIAVAIAAVLVVAAIVTIWRSVVASREAERARANAIVLAAESSTDPLTGALLLSELQDYDDPDDGTRVAQRLGSLILPTALMRGHTGRLVKVAHSPNLTRVLTASNDGTARLWPIDGKGDPIVFQGHTEPLTDAQFNSDGSLIATASKDKTARIWAASGNEARRVFEHDSSVLSAQFSFDNEWLATVSEKGLGGELWNVKGTDKRSLSLPDNRRVVQIWLSRTNFGGWVAAADASVWSFQYDSSGTLSLNQVLGTAKEQDDYFPSELIDKVTFSPNGSHVAVVFQNKALVRRMDNKATVVLAHDDWVNSVDFNQDGTQIVTSCWDGKARLWTTDTGEVSKTLDVKVRYFVLDLSGQKPSREDKAMRAVDARFSHNGSRIVALFEDGVIRIWNVGYDGDTTELRGNPGVEIASFGIDDTQLITGADDGTARVWPLSPPTEPFVFGHTKAVDTACLSKDGEKVATGSRDGITHLWPMSDPQRRIELKAAEGAVKEVSFDKSGTQLATAQDSGSVNLWDVSDLNNPTLKKQFSKVGQKFTGVEFSQDGRRLLAWAHGGDAYVWSIDGNQESILKSADPDLWYAEFDPAGSRVVTAYDDGTVRVWKADGSGSYVTLTSKEEPTATTYRARFSPDGLRVLTVSENGTAWLWNSNGTGEPVRIAGPNPGKDAVENCAFSPDGKRFVITTSAGRAWLFSANGQGTPTVLRSVADLAHIGSIMAIAFSRDSKRIVTGGGIDARVYVWQADGSGKPMALVGHQGTISWAGFNTDGSRIITASEDGSTRIWRTSWHDLISYLRTLTSASLTPEQRIIYLGESEDAARAAYEQEERRFGRTPLPANWQFSYPF